MGFVNLSKKQSKNCASMTNLMIVVFRVLYLTPPVGEESLEAGVIAGVRHMFLTSILAQVNTLVMVSCYRNQSFSSEKTMTLG